MDSARIRRVLELGRNQRELLHLQKQLVENQQKLKELVIDAERMRE
jgi:hypothetical protein